MQVQRGLIALVLIVLWNGRKPTNRQQETLRFHWTGWAEVDDLKTLLWRENIGVSELV